MKFFQKECMQYLDEYMLIDGVHLVKRVASTDNFKFNRLWCFNKILIFKDEKSGVELANR